MLFSLIVISQNEAKPIDGDCQKCKKLLTTFSSGTDLLNVHSWLLTKESEKKKKEKEKLSHGAV